MARILFRNPAAQDEVLTQLVRRLTETYRPEKIILFGSAARGDAGPDGDYDLMVIVPDNVEAELKQSRAGYRAVRDLGVPKDIFVCTATDFNRQLHLKASFPATVLREGLLLYES